MKMRVVPVLFAVMACVSAFSQAAQVPVTVTHFVNGLWFDGTRFVTTDFYATGSVLSHRNTGGLDGGTVDLQGGYVVPPYGDAHEHNFDGIRGTAEETRLYLKDGIFYAQGMTDTTEGAAEVITAGMVNTPSTVDVTYAHGGLTGLEGHPKDVYEALANGFYYGMTNEQKKIVLGSHGREGKAYWEIDTPVDLEKKWPKILASKPDLIKIYLSDSEQYTADSHVHPVPGRGLDPALVPLIIARAHAAGLKVAAHVDTATDYHIALTAGVDEMGHMPGYGMVAKDNPATYRLSDADVALTAKRHVVVQATASLAVNEQTPAADLAARRALQIDNLKRLKAAGVTVVAGSDHYGQDSVHEADYLQSLGVWSNLEMLRMWSVATPRDIFPKRKIGELKDGYEASFLVLAANPLDDWTATHRIVGRWKQGQHIVVAEPAR